MAMVPRVLVVDDDPVIRELLQAYLGEEGYDVLCAGNAEQAEACLAECAHLGQPVELVLLDIRLPGKAGLTLTRELRVPVIDGVSAAVKMVESLVALGLATSKHGDLAFPEKKALSGQFQSLNPF